MHIGLVQVAIKPLTRKCINAFVLMCLRDARFNNFKDSILGMITVSLYDGPIYFNCYLLENTCYAAENLMDLLHSKMITCTM